MAYLSLDFSTTGCPHGTEGTVVCRQETGPRRLTPDHGSKLREMLGRLNICSKEYVVRQYDHEVQAGSVVKPLVGDQCDGPSDAAVVRPLLDSEEGVVVANGIIPHYSDLDTYHMAACALDEALRTLLRGGQ